MLYVPLDFENNLVIEALVDSGAFVSAITQETNSNPNNRASNNTNANNLPNQRDRRSTPVYPRCETCGRPNHSTEKW